MCDYGLNYSTGGPYTIPEFVGSDQLQSGPNGEAHIIASSKGNGRGSMETGIDTDDDVIFIMSRPMQRNCLLSGPVVNNSTYCHQGPPPLQGSLFDHPIIHSDRTFRSRGAPQVAPPVPKRSKGNFEKESTASREDRLLRAIVADRQLRKDRARAIAQLEKAAAKIIFESEQAPLQISELLKLSEAVTSKTETTPDRLFTRHLRLAKKKHRKSQQEGNESKASGTILQPLNVKLDRGKELKTASVSRGKALDCNVKKTSRNLLKLHNAVNSGVSIPESQFKAVQGHIKQLCEALELDEEVELLKFDFLYNLRF